MGTPSNPQTPPHFYSGGEGGRGKRCQWFYISHLAMFLELNLLNSSPKTCLAKMSALTFSFCVKRYPCVIRYTLSLIRIIAFSLYCAPLITSLIVTLLKQVHICCFNYILGIVYKKLQSRRSPVIMFFKLYLILSK